MTHDWSQPFGGPRAIAELDARIDSIITSALERDVSVQMPELKAPQLTFDDLVEEMESISVIREAVRRAQEADMTRVEEALARTAEDEGVVVAMRHGRVVYAEPSCFVPALTAYVVDASSWGEPIGDVSVGRVPWTSFRVNDPDWSSIARNID